MDYKDVVSFLKKERKQADKKEDIETLDKAIKYLTRKRQQIKNRHEEVKKEINELLKQEMGKDSEIKMHTETHTFKGETETIGVFLKLKRNDVYRCQVLDFKLEKGTGQYILDYNAERRVLASNQITDTVKGILESDELKEIVSRIKKTV